MSLCVVDVRARVDYRRRTHNSSLKNKSYSVGRNFFHLVGPSGGGVGADSGAVAKTLVYVRERVSRGIAIDFV